MSAGGVTMFRGSAGAASAYVEADHFVESDYYLEHGLALAQMTAFNEVGTVVGVMDLDAESYRRWVGMEDLETGEQRRFIRGGERSTPLFAEMNINSAKSLSVAAALSLSVSVSLDVAQAHAALVVGEFIASHAVTRVGPANKLRVVPAERVEVTSVVHRTSRAGDPHRHIHLQTLNAVYAEGKWRGLWTNGIFKQQGAIRALTGAVIAGSPVLHDAIDHLGLTLDVATGEVVQLEGFNQAFSKRSVQVQGHFAVLEAAWEAEHPGERAGPALTAIWQREAWDKGRPRKAAHAVSVEAKWADELADLGFDLAAVRTAVSQPRVSLGSLDMQALAVQAVTRVSSMRSAWGRFDITEAVARLVQERGVIAEAADILAFVEVVTDLGVGGSLNILPPHLVQLEHARNLTDLRIVGIEEQLRGRMMNLASSSTDVADAFIEGLDVGQTQAVNTIESAARFIVVEGAAGSGKTKMLKEVVERGNIRGNFWGEEIDIRIIAPTLKAAQVAAEETGGTAMVAAKLAHEHGFRWDGDGVWSRLSIGDVDPGNGRVWAGVREAVALSSRSTLIIDEAGMLNQDTALALLSIAEEAGASVVFVGDRAQLAAVGRGGVLDMAVRISENVVDMTSVHRFNDPVYAELSLKMRERTDAGAIFDALDAGGNIRIHSDEVGALDEVGHAQIVGDNVAVTVATNEEAGRLNAWIQAARLREGHISQEMSASGRDGEKLMVGDEVMTRLNSPRLGVANRQTFTVTHVEADGALYVRSEGSTRQLRLPPEYVQAHTHLAYAVTAHGQQGTTVDTSHTVLSAQSTGSSLYVAMTRGREMNTLHVVADDREQARELFVEAMGRDIADRGLAHATELARQEVSTFAELLEDLKREATDEATIAALDGLLAEKGMVEEVEVVAPEEIVGEPVPPVPPVVAYDGAQKANPPQQRPPQVSSGPKAGNIGLTARIVAPDGSHHTVIGKTMKEESVLLELRNVKTKEINSLEVSKSFKLQLAPEEGDMGFGGWESPTPTIGLN